MSALAVIVGVILLGATGLGVLLWALCAAAGRADEDADRFHRAAIDRADAAQTERRRRLQALQADFEARRHTRAGRR